MNRAPLEQLALRVPYHKAALWWLALLYRRTWVGQLYGLSRLDPATEQFTNYRPDPRNPTWNGSSVSGIYQDRSGTLWLGTTGGALIRVDDKPDNVVDHPPEYGDY